jgi:hypothetical protein
MKCEGCSIETSVATYSPDPTGLMCWWCTDCAAKEAAGAIRWKDPRLATLKAALLEACDFALCYCLCADTDGTAGADIDRINELRELAGEP